MVDQATEAGQKGLVGLVGERVDSPSTPPYSTQRLSRHTLSSADPLSSLHPGEGAPGEANPCMAVVPRGPALNCSFLPSPAMDQVAKTTQETIDKTANQASETFSGFGKKFGLLK